MKRLFVLMSCAVLLSACASRTQMPAWKPVARTAAPKQIDAQGNSVPRLRAGVSSATVEKLASAEGCTGGQGASLISEPGPVETYRMVCESGQSFVAKCEFRQCKAVALPPAGGYAMRAPAPVAAPVVAAPVSLPPPQLASVVATSPVDAPAAMPVAAAAPVEAAPVGSAPLATSRGPVEIGTRAGLAPMEVPKLQVIWDCGKCEENLKVAPLIAQAYASMAASKGFTVSTTQTAAMTIHRYRQRPVAVRVLFGIMAGTDYLKTRVQFDGKTVIAEDYSANAMYGMDRLCDVVGPKAFAELVAVAK
jgi:hypothetical protein